MYQFGQEEIDAALAVLTRKELFRYTSSVGEAVAFERELASRTGAAHALLVSSGTAALICALTALRLEPEDEVIIPAYGFIADVLAVLAAGAVPVVCEIDETLTIDPLDLRRRITPRTRAIVPVHMNGFVCDMEKILAIAREHKLAVVEDACQAIGGTWRTQPLGTLGDIGVFSFNQFKTLSAGEGGAVVTNDTALYERAFIAHDGSCGSSPHRFSEPLFDGLAFRASELTAAILRVQLRRLDEILAGLRRTRDRIVEMLGSTEVMRRIPSHDREGDCGTTVAFCFPTAELADRFCSVARQAKVFAAKGGCHLHSYAEWNLPASRLQSTRAFKQSHPYDPNAYPASAEILARTALLACSLEMNEEAIANLAERLSTAGLV